MSGLGIAVGRHYGDDEITVLNEREKMSVRT